MNNTRLQAKVEARNLANAAALEYGPRIIAALAPFLGQSVLLQTGGKTAKLQKALDALNLPDSCPVNGQLQVIIRAERYWFRAEFRTCVGHDKGCVYETQTVNLGDIDGKTLTKLAEPPTSAYCRTNYSAEEIAAARAAVKSVRDELHQAERRLCGFGEHDNN
jgi:hypothetical protein